MHDLVDYEVRGIPSVMVASAEFSEAAVYQAAALGMPDLSTQAVFIAHPIQGTTDDDVRSKARGAFDAVVRALTDSTP